MLSPDVGRKISLSGHKSDKPLSTPINPLGPLSPALFILAIYIPLATFLYPSSHQNLPPCAPVFLLARRVSAPTSANDDPGFNGRPAVPPKKEMFVRLIARITRDTWPSKSKRFYWPHHNTNPPKSQRRRRNSPTTRSLSFRSPHSPWHLCYHPSASDFSRKVAHSKRKPILPRWVIPQTAPPTMTHPNPHFHATPNCLARSNSAANTLPSPFFPGRRRRATLFSTYMTVPGSTCGSCRSLIPAPDSL